MWNDLLYRLRAVFKRRTVETELDEELGFHLEHEIGKYLKAGMSREEAMRKARLALGGVEQVKEECRENRGVALWETTLQDLRYAARQMAKAPAFTLAVVLTLALGIGSTTGLFTLANSLLLRPLAVRNPGELAIIARNPARPFPLHNYADYALLRDHRPGAFAGVAASNEGNAVGFTTVGPAQGGSGVPDVVSAAFVSVNYFEVLGVGASAGRMPSPGDGSGGAPWVVLSYDFWQRRFDANPEAVGQPVRLNSQIFNVAGVASRGFTGTHAGSAPDLYVALETFPAVIPLMRKNWNSPRRQWLVLTARLNPGVSLARSAAEIDSLMTGSGGRCVLLPGARGASFGSQFSEPLWILLLAASLLLLLACANVAGLLLARAIHREREIAVRLALGASRPRLIRQMLTESLLLSLTGGALGLMLGLAGARVMAGLLPSSGPFPLTPDLAPDARVLGFALGASVLTALLFGIGPALRSSRRDLAPSFKGPVGKGRGGLMPDPRRALVATQVALSLVLLVGVGLVARTLGRLDALDFGFSRDGLLFVYVQPGQFGYEGARARDFYERLRERVAGLHGVRQTSLADYAPLDGGNDSGTVSRPGGQSSPAPVESNAITAGYLNTLGISLLAGRDVTARDGEAGAPAVGLISESLARSLFPAGENPIGQRLSYGERFQGAESWLIVGVVRDARYFGLREKPTPMVYLPVEPTMSRMVLCMRIDGAPPESLIPAVRREVAALDRAVPVLEAHTMTERVNEQNAAERLLATLLGAFGFMALVLAAIGLHGVLAFEVAARSREIGIRTALGAQKWDAVSRVLTEVLLLAGAGAAVGLAISLGGARLLSGFLFGVQPFDPISFAGALAVLAAAAAVASYVPARRAARVDPLVALRHD